jgi:hypothetical protein
MVNDSSGMALAASQRLGGHKKGILLGPGLTGNLSAKFLLSSPTERQIHRVEEDDMRLLILSLQEAVVAIASMDSLESNQVKTSTGNNRYNVQCTCARKLKRTVGLLNYVAVLTSRPTKINEIADY